MSKDKNRTTVDYYNPWIARGGRGNILLWILLKDYHKLEQTMMLLGFIDLLMKSAHFYQFVKCTQLRN